MGKILTYGDIKAEGGYINTNRIIDQGSVLTYEGDNHCPSAKDWNLRVYNVKNPYSPSSTQCTDTIDTANAYKVSFGYGCLDHSLTCLELRVIFEDGLNYTIVHSYGSTGVGYISYRFTIGTSNYPSSNYAFYGFNDDQYLYYHGSSFYKIESMTVRLSKPVTGGVQLYSGTYSGTTKRLFNFGPRLSVPTWVTNVSTLTVENVTIPYADFGSQSFLIFIGLSQDFTS